MRKLLLILFCLLSVLAVQVQTTAAEPSVRSGLVINEFLAANTSTLLSPDYFEYDDWIELRNNGPGEINLNGYSLTDDLEDPGKWRIKTDIRVSPGGIILFWADGRDQGLHANFKLDRDGEEIGLFAPDGSVADTLTFGFQRPDVSCGRMPDHPDELAYFSPPTPSAGNFSAAVQGLSDPPRFSVPGGFYSGGLAVAFLNAGSSIQIRYTLDGTPPKANSALYSAPIELHATAAIRARAFESGKIPSEPATRTYFIDDPVHLPFISIVTDPANLFDDEIGIYVTGTNGRPGDCDPTVRNLNQDWERPVNIELYEKDGTRAFNQQAGIKIFGGCSRTRYPQKSFAVYARSEYGKGSFEYRLFPGKPVSEFEAFLLRSAADDQVYTMMRDALAQNALARHMDIDYQAYQPAAVFINGAYWGIHNIREKLNGHYFEENYGVDPDDVNFLERDPYQSDNVIQGSARSYNEMLDFIKTCDMSIPGNYEYIKTRMDVNEYIDYQIAHIHLAEKDWPGNNIKFWNTHSEKSARWRWVCMDMDQTFIYTGRNALALAKQAGGRSWPNPDWSTVLFRNLLESPDFRNSFIQTYAYHLSTAFEPERLVRFIDSLQTDIAPEIPRHIGRWGGRRDPDCHESWNTRPTFNSVEEWESNVEVMKTFARERPAFAVKNMIDEFGLGGTVRLTVRIDPPGAGRLEINSHAVPDDGYSALYFKDIPFAVQAFPRFGYRFQRWKLGGSFLSDEKTAITLSGDDSLTVCFERDTTHYEKWIAINEINYHSSDACDPGDWIEIYNGYDRPVDVGDWFLKDENDFLGFRFPAHTRLDSHGFLVVCGDSSSFHALFPDVSSRIGNPGFGLNNGGETIRLFADDDHLIDSVRYSDRSPWPEDPDGKGPTLELKAPGLDNGLAQNWASSIRPCGTPGRPNSVLTEIEETDDKTGINHFALYGNYPNPFNSATVIRYSIREAGTVRLSLYDVRGRHVRTWVDRRMPAGDHETLWDGMDENGKSAPSGIYIFTLTTLKHPMRSGKMLFIK